MKTSSKFYFILGVLATIGTMTLVFSALEDTEKSPKELLDDGKKFIKKTVKKGDRLIDQTVDSIEKETKAVIKDASKVV